ERRLLGQGGKAALDALVQRRTQGAVAEQLPALLGIVDRNDRPASSGRACGVEDLTLGQHVASRMHCGKHRLVLLLGTAWKVMHDCVGHNVLWSTERAGANSCAPGQSTLHRGGDPGNTRRSL